MVLTFEFADEILKCVHSNESYHEDPHKILFGSLLEAIVATDAIYNYITESQKCVNPINSQ